jgi:hypothetical protein
LSPFPTNGRRLGTGVANILDVTPAKEGDMRTTTATPTPMNDIRKKLIDADSLLDQGLIAIQQGSSLEAMENVYTASCLIEDIRAALDHRYCVDKPSS